MHGDHPATQERVCELLSRMTDELRTVNAQLAGITDRLAEADRCTALYLRTMELHAEQAARNQRR